MAARMESRSVSRTYRVSRAGNSRARPASITRRPTPNGRAANSRQPKPKWRAAMLKCIRPVSGPGVHTTGRIAKAPNGDETVHASKSVLFGSRRNARTSYALLRPASAVPAGLFRVSVSGPCSFALACPYRRQCVCIHRSTIAGDAQSLDGDISRAPARPRAVQISVIKDRAPVVGGGAPVRTGCARLPAGRPIHGPQIHFSDSG